MPYWKCSFHNSELPNRNMDIERKVLFTYNFVRDIVLIKLKVALVWLALELHRWGEISDSMKRREHILSYYGKTQHRITTFHFFKPA